MGITLDQLVNSINKVKQYSDKKFPVVSPDESNAIIKNENGIFVEDKQPQIDELKEKINPIAKYQKYVNTELDYCHANANYANSLNYTSTFNIQFQTCNTNMDIDEEKQFITLKANKQYNVQYTSRIGSSGECQAGICILTEDGEEICLGVDSTGVYDKTWDGKCINAIISFEKDTKICIQYYMIQNTITSVQADLSIIEINRQIVIDPLEHVNTTQGIEDTPVGHIISHIGNIVLKHYLACDGNEYNISDYPYLAQHIEDSFGIVNYFGGDGINTFAVPLSNSPSKSLKSIIPPITSNTNDEGYEISASSEYDTTGNYSPWRVFDKSSSSCWAGQKSVTTGWIQIKLPKKENIRAFSLTSRNLQNSSTSFSNFSLLGSNDNSTWTNILSLTNQPSWSFGETRTYQIPDGIITNYQYYRISFTSTSGTQYLSVGEIDLFINNYTEYIKYEPTYFTQIQNTNYLQPSFYSEEEQIIGSWINGKPLYQITINIGNITFEKDKPVSITNELFTEIDLITKCTGQRLSNFAYGSANIYINTNHKLSENFVSCYTVNQWGSLNYLTIQYTKTIDAENSFTKDMLTNYIPQNDSADSEITDEELQQAISNIVEEINKEEEVVVVQDDTEIQEQIEPINDDLEESIDNPDEPIDEEQTLEPEEEGGAE